MHRVPAVLVWYPASQEQRKPPGVLMHRPPGRQWAGSLSHSSTSDKKSNDDNNGRDDNNDKDGDNKNNDDNGNKRK